MRAREFVAETKSIFFLQIVEPCSSLRAKGALNFFRYGLFLSTFLIYMTLNISL